MLSSVGVQYVEFPPGARITTHRHPETEALVLTIAGRCRALLDGQERFLGPGDVLHVNKGTWHRYETVGWQPWKNLVIHSPRAYGGECADDIEHWDRAEPEYLDEPTAVSCVGLGPWGVLSDIGELDHYAMAVRDAERVARFYTTAFGFELVRRQDCIDARGGHRGDARLITLQLPESKQLVIGMPLHENSTLHQTIEKLGEGVHHVAYRVRNLDQTVARLRAAGIDFTTEDAVRDPVTGLRQVFIRREHTGGTFVELIERSPDKPEGYVEHNVASLVASEAAFEAREAAGISD
jgi:methylmalonyl-CoA/ethylmalonyl-CoA epimerase